MRAHAARRERNKDSSSPASSPATDSQKLRKRTREDSNETDDKENVDTRGTEEEPRSIRPRRGSLNRNRLRQRRGSLSQSMKEWLTPSKTEKPVDTNSVELSDLGRFQLHTILLIQFPQ